MCGIAGAIDLTQQGRIDPSLVRQMTALIKHRGPDGDGFYEKKTTQPTVSNTFTTS